jgi:hypothetical protein
VTPEDLAAIRASWVEYQDGERNDVFVLADALEQSWRDRDAERREYATAWAQECALVNEMRERAERAEAEVERQKSLRERDYIDSYDLVEDRQKAEAALARVRALCEELHDTDEIVTEAYDRLRAAIEGDNQ